MAEERLETLEEVFSKGETEAPEPEREAEVEAKGDKGAPPAPETDEKAQDKSESKDESEAKSDEDQPWHLKAVLDEREKRQKYERELQEARKRLEEYEAKKEAERPDVFEDQDGAFKWVDQKLSQVEMTTRFNLSREMMSMVKDDYEQRETEFLELAQQNPELISQLKAHPNPAKFAYEKATQAARLKEMENIDDYKAKIEAEIRQKVEAEYAERMKSAESEAEQKRKSITPSLASSRSAGTKEEIRLDRLEDILPT